MHKIISQRTYGTFGTTDLEKMERSKFRRGKARKHTVYEVRMKSVNQFYWRKSLESCCRTLPFTKRASRQPHGQLAEEGGQIPDPLVPSSMQSPGPYTILILLIQSQLSQHTDLDETPSYTELSSKFLHIFVKMDKASKRTEKKCSNSISHSKGQI